MDGPWFLHVDLDQFQVSVERLRNPELAHETLIVGGEGDPTQLRKVVTCASYEARAHGVRAGMPLRTAYAKLPDAVFLPLDVGAYDAASEQVMSTLRGFGHPVEVWGWDEAYLAASVDDPRELAQRIRERVFAECGLPCAVGIGQNKQQAKIATGFAKARGYPTGLRSSGGRDSDDDADKVFALSYAEWMPLMGTRPVQDLWGVGPRIADRLNRLGIKTIAELAESDEGRITAEFGPKAGQWLPLLARGGGDRSIATEPPIAKGHSKNRTYPKDLEGRDEIAAALADLTAELLQQIVAEGRVAMRVEVTVRTKTFYTRTKSRKLAAPTTDLQVLTDAALAVLDKFELDRPVRLLAIRFELVMPEGDAT
ncbi:DNA polymerase IV [Jongsikchunia kroppenstedtii]|uniref:DNA polymerase IV n=1 Tax=Jongsikchunia kroppenstedtii TaxID=1121721 RepID=UPI00037257BE|nr:DNA polymerase IV [Jongsikchunia kroppenstedtii]